MGIYNGHYKRYTSILISTDDHDITRDLAAKAKYLCSAWANLGVSCREWKSARKGNVLKREIMINQVMFGHFLLIFEESLNCIFGAYFRDGSVTITHRDTSLTD